MLFGFEIILIFESRYLLNSYSNVYSRVVEEIESNRPAVIAMFESYGATMNHSVVVYGYKEVITSTKTTITYYVQTGWGSSLRASYSYTWFADCLFLVEQ